jgi:hypothetical protein
MSISRLTALLAIALCCATGAPAAPYSFVTFDASAPGLLGTVVTGINNNQEITGYYVTFDGFAQVYHAFSGSAQGGALTGIDHPGALATGAASVNNAGETVGVFVDSLGTAHGFLRSPGGAFTTIDPSGAGFAPAYTEAVGINDAGSIVGYYTDIPPASPGEVQALSHGFIFDGTTYSHFDVPAAVGFGTQPYVINNSGQITGSYLDGMGALHGFLFVPGSGFSTIDPPGAVNSTTGGNNNLGVIVGAALVPDPGSPTGDIAFGYIYSGGNFVPFGVPGAFSTEPLSINDLGQITGLFIDQTGIHGFVASLVPEPATLALLGVGLLGIGAGRRRCTSTAGPACARGIGITA